MACHTLIPNNPQGIQYIDHSPSFSDAIHVPGTWKAPYVSSSNMNITLPESSLYFFSSIAGILGCFSWRLDYLFPLPVIGDCSIHLYRSWRGLGVACIINYYHWSNSLYDCKFGIQNRCIGPAKYFLYGHWSCTTYIRAFFQFEQLFILLIISWHVCYRLLSLSKTGEIRHALTISRTLSMDRTYPSLIDLLWWNDGQCFQSSVWCPCDIISIGFALCS